MADRPPEQQSLFDVADAAGQRAPDTPGRADPSGPPPASDAPVTPHPPAPAPGRARPDGPDRAETGPTVAPDQPARHRIRTDLDTTLFVEAGAGSGKTAALVDRVAALVTTGGVELGHIAAITFTEKAGAELRDRIRRRLEELAGAEGDAGGDEHPVEDRDSDGRVAADRSSRCRAALDQLDGAAIGTLHAFAQRLLSEHPVEAGLPPRIEVLDEVGSGVAFARRWSVFLDHLLEDPALERTILLLRAAGVRPLHLRLVAEAFDANWDLVDELVKQDAPDPPSVHELLAPVVDAVRAVCAEPCRDAQDRLRVRLDAIAHWVGSLASITDEVDLLQALSPSVDPKPPSFKVGGRGKPKSYDCDMDELRRRVRDAGDALGAVRDTVAEACALRLGAEIRRFTLQAAAERRRTGELEFHDLLVLARALLRHRHHGPAVRATLHRRYRRLLLDEFQDTDPIQIELAVRIAAATPDSDAAGDEPWPEVAVQAGHLFVVGDPKQSIYRFRRADIATFLAAATRFGAGGGAVELTANFRTAAPVIDWINTTFASLMDDGGPSGAAPADAGADDAGAGETGTGPDEGGEGGEGGGEGRPASQPRYVALTATRPAPPDGPPVAVLGRRPHPSERSADDLRAAEALDVAAAVTRAVGEGWPVEEKGRWRPARLGDVTVLVPSRTSLPFLEDAFEEAGIAYRTESSSLVYAGRAVRDLLMVVRAVDDPTDYLRVVSALRTPLLACGDDDLFRFKVERGGQWSYLADQPDTVPEDDPVRRGLAYLRSLYDERHWRAPSELLGRIVRDRRVLELGFAEGRPRDVWKRVRFVVDQARAWSEAAGGNLRQYLQWVALQTAEGARVAEAILPESDDDAVRVMTIHSAKGLEFPIAILSGMSTVPGGRRAPVEVVFPHGDKVGYRFGSSVKTDEYQDWAPIDEQMNFHERIRLLYVACTRARDHLVVSLHRKEHATAPAPGRRTNAELLVAGMGAVLDDLPDAAPAPASLPAAPVAPPPPPPPFGRWAAERDEALRRASVAGAVAATGLTDEGGPDSEGEPDAGLRKQPRDIDLPPWLKGRYGTSVGRAVHGVLQTVDLGDGAGLEEALAAQCEAEAVPDRIDTVRRLVLDALGSPTVRRAAGAPHWREVYACTPVGGRLLEGYVDLLYRGPDGLVVVDHKTASSADPDELDRRVAGYRLQGASYALVVAASTGEAVTRVTFLFLTPEGAVERDLPHLDRAVDEVRRRVTEGRDVVVE